jgi:zinc protease
VSDPENLPGRANLVANMLTEGAGQRKSSEFKRALADNAIQLSYSAGYDRFYGNLTTTTGRLDKAIELGRDSLLSPRFDEDALLRTKAAILSQLNSQRADPGYQAARTLRRFGYDGHPYARPKIGTADSIANITASDLVQFRHNRLTKDSLQLAVVGDISYFKARRLIGDLFGDLPDTGAKVDVGSTALSNTGEVISVQRTGAQSVMLQAFNGIDRNNPDWYAASVLNYILGGGDFSSRLMQDLRSDRGWTYGISSALRPDKYAPRWVIRSGLQPQNIPATIDRVKYHMTRLQDKGPTDTEVASAIEYLTGSFALEFSSTDSIADILLTIQLYDLGRDYLDQRDQLFRTVTRDKVQQVAKDYLRPDDILTILVGPEVDGLTPDQVAKAE